MTPHNSKTNKMRGKKESKSYPLATRAAEILLRKMMKLMDKKEENNEDETARAN
jgi:hypothetical protein